jgi:4-amino-4-deoxy-L-arabinose transferase-like glycosyltransferase
LLADYLIKIEQLTVGDMFQGRLSCVLAGLLTVYVVYRIVLDNLGARQALFALTLATFGQYYIGTSRLAIEEPFMLLFASLVIYNLLGAIRTERSVWVYLTALSFAACYYAKVTAVLLVPVILVFLLFVPPHRTWFRNKHLYVAAALAFLLILPHLLWMAANASNEEVYYNDFLAIGFSFRMFYLLFGELAWHVSRYVDSLCWYFLGEGSLGACAVVAGGKLQLRFGDPDNEFPIFFWVFSVVAFIAAVDAAVAFRKREPAIQFSLVMIVFLTVCVTLVEGRPIGILRGAQWASAAVLPATVLAAQFLRRLELKHRYGGLIPLFVLVCVLINLRYYLEERSSRNPAFYSEDFCPVAEIAPECFWPGD